MSEIGLRLKRLIKSSGFNNKTFAEKTDVAPNYISILIRTGDVSDKFKYNIRKVIPNVNMKWLETGVGYMFIDESIKLSNSETETITKFTEELDAFDIDKIVVYLINNEEKFKSSKTYKLFLKSIVLDEAEKIADEKIKETVERIKKDLSI